MPLPLSIILDIVDLCHWQCVSLFVAGLSLSCAQVNVANISMIVREILMENIIRGRYGRMIK